MINEGQRHIFFVVFLFLHALVATLGFLHYFLKDNLVGARAEYGITFVIARAAALVLHVDVIFILLPVCRNFISVMRRTPVGMVIPFDKNLTLHKATAWAIFIGSWVHTIAHIFNLYHLTMNDTSATTTGQRVVFFIVANFIIGPLITGWIMLIILTVVSKKFWYSHHLFIPFFILWQFHGMFCMIKPDRPPYCSLNTIGVFWRYWIIGGIIWIYERILREVRSRHVTYISKVVQHPTSSSTAPRSRTSNGTPSRSPAPEEDYISVHIRVEGDFTTAFAKALGCDLARAARTRRARLAERLSALTPTRPLNRTLPRVMVDGPFGTSSEEFLNYETVLLVGAGIGVTPFASILKNIWYRMNNFNTSKPTRLSKVLLHAIGEQDTQNRIEINIYLTAKIKEDDMNNIFVQDVGAEKDSITSLQAPTHFGRPNWDKIFSPIAEKHPESDGGVFFCGPAGIAHDLHIKSNKHSDVNAKGGTRFIFGKDRALTLIKPRTVRACIIAAVQHNVLWHANSEEEGEVFEMNIEECLLRLRFGRFVWQAGELFGNPAAEIVQLILDHGKLRRQRLSRISRWATRRAMHSLVTAAYLKPSTILSHVSPRDKRIRYEAEEKAKISGFPTAKELREARETAEARLKRRRGRGGESWTVSGLQKRKAVEQTGPRTPKRKAVEEEEVVDPTVYFRVNCDRFNVHIRNALIVKTARERYNPSVALVLQTILKATEAKQKDVSEARTGQLILSSRFVF
ncbi:FAD-binding FR-type domain-containing protein [Mycena chlorophos]|uniref:FAD-binding FR-type domain-containing protein n=1 Tax=Mycena chlorophos TaxID=658473 RepID=A0A8H6TA12_MYCCL|nr:FAD-binding FR-type domain-containing protein [Mycena chlorophos]